MAQHTMADLRQLCEANNCVPAWRAETNNGRVYCSLSATQDKPMGKMLYDIRSDWAWDDVHVSGLIDQAMAEWFK